VLENMTQRYRMYRRQGGIFYLFDRQTGQRESLETNEPSAAQRLLHARNEAQQNPLINLQIARAYLAAGDPEAVRRTWRTVMEEITRTKMGEARHRWETAVKDHAFDTIRDRIILETHSEHLLRVLEAGTVSTNVYLRRLHNFALDMNWLPWPVVPKRQWPSVKFGQKRGITWEEHQKIITREPNTERKAFYQLAWHLGASQSDLAFLETENIDWERRVISYTRKKTRTMALMRFDEEMADILLARPAAGPLFPYLRRVRAGDRATEVKQRCEGLGIRGVSLHSYRYAWAERAKQAGYPERFAQEALGHNSKAVHRAYARRAQVELPSLGEYERQRAKFAETSQPGALAASP